MIYNVQSYVLKQLDGNLVVEDEFAGLVLGAIFSDWTIPKLLVLVLIDLLQRKMNRNKKT